MDQINELPTATTDAPISVNRKVAPPRRRKNVETRSREHLLPSEVTKLLKAAGRSGRYGQRNRTLVTLMYRHGLRVSEAVSLRWDQVDLDGGLLHVARLKNGTPSTHPLRGPELRDLRQLRREWPESSYLFVSERGGPMKTGNVRKLLTRLGESIGLPHLHPHQLRHALGYYLANAGHDTRAIQHYLGHKNIHHTTRYTELAPDRFKTFFRD